MSDYESRVADALAGEYRVEEKIGEGGMALVFLATDLKHGRKVAVKVMRPEYSETLGAERFLQEIDTAANLNHPHILPVHDSGDADGILYFVMPFVEGESLADRIRREGPLPIADALMLTREVADALAYAHSHGVIHRDIKPDNVMLYGGHAVITDFGIAKAARAAESTQLTGHGMSLGTPSYMSPEQATADDVDARTDIYALACVLYEQLVGEPPFTGDNSAAVIQQHVVAPPPSATDRRASIPAGVSQAIQKGMAKTPGDRFVTAAAFSDALAQEERAGGASVMTPVLQGLVAYGLVMVAVYWLLTVFVNRFVWSPHLPTFGAVALLTLAPVLTMFLVQRARGGSLSRVGKVGLPANAVGAVAVLWLAFGSTDLGAATTTVVVEDEDGNAVERVVPKSDFRKNVFLFPFDNATGDSSLDWMQHGLPLAMSFDLQQDMFINVRSSETMAEEFRDRGYPGAVGVPLTLKRELAEDAPSPYFLAGSYAFADGGLALEVQLYETDRSRLLEERTYWVPMQDEPESFFQLADDASLQLKKDLGIPSQHIADTQDLPVVDQLTASVDAYRNLTEAYRTLTFEQDWAASGEAVRASIALDSTNAYAHLLHYGIAMFSNDRQNAMHAIESAMQHSYKLPERTQFQLKTQYYDFRQEADRALAVAEMRVDLFPDDIQGRGFLAQLYSLRDRAEEAMEQLEAIVELDPSQTQLLQQLGGLARGEGQFDRAREYFERYAAAHPDEPTAFTSLAGLQRQQGDFDGARDTYERALLLEPGAIPVRISMATLLRHEGDIPAGRRQLEGVLADVTGASDSVSVLGALQGLAESAGQMNDAVALFEQQLGVSRQFLPPVQILGTQLGGLETYVKAGREAQARQILAAVEQQLQAPFDQLGSMGHMSIAVALRDIEGIEAAIPGVQALIAGLGIQTLQPALIDATALMAELGGDCAQAIELRSQVLERTPTRTSTHLHIARCRRLTGDYDGAVASLQLGLVPSPYNAEMHYEYALTLQAQGDLDGARAHADTAMAVWAQADEGYEPARLARELQAELAAR